MSVTLDFETRFLALSRSFVSFNFFTFFINIILDFQGFFNVQGLGLKEIADQHFQEKEYEIAASLYSMALKCRINNTPLEEAYGIAVQIYRKRDECFFKLVC